MPVAPPPPPPVLEAPSPSWDAPVAPVAPSPAPAWEPPAAVAPPPPPPPPPSWDPPAPAPAPVWEPPAATVPPPAASWDPPAPVAPAPVYVAEERPPLVPPPPAPPVDLAPPSPPPAPLPPAAAPAPVPASDPHRIGVAVGGLGMFAKRAGRACFAVVGALLEDGELVDVLVQGRFNGEDGVAVATDRRVLLVNDREWKPDVVALPYLRGMVVKGWQDDRSASLIFEFEGATVTIEQIGERELAQRLAAVVRARVA